ncbi:MAG: hypothetical protein IJE07_12185 [Clostridia bacterium]|nr:hypothetical protein [Clostridia bacterium]
MTLMQLLALTPPLCRMAEDPGVRAALAILSSQPDADPAPLAAAMNRHPDDARRAMTILGCGDAPSAETLRRRFPREALAFFHLCGQCTAAEILAVLTRCTVCPTAEALALLIGHARREQAERLYALQLLWRMGGDAALPDAIALFPPDTPPARPARDIAHTICQRLQKEAP